jgi:hypothetical protein
MRITTVTLAALSLGTPLLLATSDATAQGLAERIRGVAEQRQAAAAHDNTGAALLGSLLYTDLAVNFDETPCREAFNYLKSLMGVDLVVRYNDDRTGMGLDPEAPITLKVTNKPAITIIELMLEQASDLDPSTWQLRNGYIEVGTKERLSVSAARELRMYPIRDLLFEIPHFDNAPKFDLNSSINQGGGGGGGGSGGGGGGSGGGGGGGFGGGGGGGNGGGGGGNGGGGGGGGGGGVFGEPGDEPERMSEEEKIAQIVDLILETVEPDAWIDNGGDAASIRFYQGVIIVRAPDYVHRQIGGYPFSAQRGRRTTRAIGVESRYVQFTSPISIVQNVDFGRQTVTGAAGGTPRP